MLMDLCVEPDGFCNIVDSNQKVVAKLTPKDGTIQAFELVKGMVCYFTNATVTFRRQK